MNAFKRGYRTITANRPDELDKLVNEAIAEGWQLCGSAYSSNDGDSDAKFHQPIMKPIKAVPN